MVAVMDDRAQISRRTESLALPHCLDGEVRHDWTRAEVDALFELPFPDLIFHAQRIHRMHFDPREVQVSTLLSIKTGGCPEDCAYCPQSARLPHRRQRRKVDGHRGGHRSGTCREGRRREPLLHGSGMAFAEGARSRPVCAMVEGVRTLGLETCATLGMLDRDQARRAEGRGPRFLQSQPRHLAGVLRRNHHDADAIRIASTRSIMCAQPASTCAAAASSAWARRAPTASD